MNIRRRADGSHTVAPEGVEFVCDFCTVSIDNDVETETYPAAKFEMIVSAEGERDTLVAVSSGEWLACRACAALIKTANRDALLERAVTNVRRLSRASGHPFDEARARVSLRQMHDVFFMIRL